MRERHLRLLAVDDHEVVLWGLRALLTPLPWVERCLVAGDGDAAEALARRYAPHVAMVDLLMAGETGLDVAARLRAAAPGVAVLLISGLGEVSRSRALALGIAGFVPKASGGAPLVQAIRAVGAGRTWFPPAPAPPPSALSLRERDVVRLMAAGATNNQIAAQLSLSPHTVKRHTVRIYRKLEAHNRAEAVCRAQHTGVIP